MRLFPLGLLASVLAYVGIGCSVPGETTTSSAHSEVVGTWYYTIGMVYPQKIRITKAPDGTLQMHHKSAKVWDGQYKHNWTKKLVRNKLPDGNVMYYEAGRDDLIYTVTPDGMLHIHQAWEHYVGMPVDEF